MSDHGGGPRPLLRFNTNAWLKREGFLAVKRGRRGFRSKIGTIYKSMKKRFPYQEHVFRSLPTSIRELLTKLDSGAEAGTWDVDWSNTKAYRFPMYFPVEGIVINLRGRQPDGIVAPDDYEKLRKEIMEKVADVRDPDSGRKVVKSVKRREEVYQGPFLENVPDILVFLDEHYEGGEGFEALIENVESASLERLSGLHRPYGILIGVGGPIKRGEVLNYTPSLIDWAPTFLYALGLPIPEVYEGRPIVEIFEDSFVESNPTRSILWVPGVTRPVGEQPQGESEREEIEEKLKGWGYM